MAAFKTEASFGNQPDDVLHGETFTHTLIRGEIKVGSSFQAEIPQGTLEALGKTDDRVMEELETLVYRPDNGLTEKEIEQFLTIAKSVGTFARALDNSSSIKQPSIHMAAAAASRDVTLAHAMNLLHQNKYDIGAAVLSLVPATGPVLCRDEMEEWSPAEASLFEEAMEKYGKDFHEIKQDFLSWKSMKNIIEYYYMWKTTDRYLQQKRIKVAEAENRARQLYISNLNQKQSLVDNNETVDNLSTIGVSHGKPCAGCHKTSSSQWFPWSSSHLSNRLCQSCYLHWKKYGELRNTAKLAPDTERNNAFRPSEASQASFPCRECDKVFNRQDRLIAHLAIHQTHRCSIIGCNKEFKFKTQLARHCAQAHGVAIRAGSPRPIMKTRAAFYLHTTHAAKLARRLCSQILKIRHAARSPFAPINVALIKQECQVKLSEGAAHIIPNLKPINRGKVVDISQRLGTPKMECPEWLILTPKDQIPVPERLAFPLPEKGKDGQYIRCRSVDLSNTEGSENNPPVMYKNSGSRSINNGSSNVRKRTHDQQNGGSESNPAVQLKRRSLAPPIMSKPTNADIYGMAGMPRGASVPSINGRPKVTTIARVGGGGRKQMMSWFEAPDDVYFVATESTKRLRKACSLLELRKGARRPWKKLSIKTSSNAINNNRGHNLSNVSNQEATELTMIQ